MSKARSLFAGPSQGVWGDKHVTKDNNVHNIIRILQPNGRTETIFPSTGKVILDNLEQFVALLKAQVQVHFVQEHENKTVSEENNETTDYPTEHPAEQSSNPSAETAPKRRRKRRPQKKS